MAIENENKNKGELSWMPLANSKYKHKNQKLLLQDLQTKKAE